MTGTYTIDDKAKPIKYDLLGSITINDAACEGATDTTSISFINDGVGQQEDVGGGDTSSIDDGRTTSCNNEEDDTYDGGDGDGGSTDPDTDGITIDDDGGGDTSTDCNKDDTDTDWAGGCEGGGSDDDSDGVTPDDDTDNTGAMLTSETFSGTTSIAISLGSCKMIGGTGTISYSVTNCEGSGEVSISSSDPNISVSLGASPAVGVRFAPITQSFSLSGGESQDGQSLNFTLTITYPDGATGSASATVFYYDNYVCGKKYKITASVTSGSGTISPVGEVWVSEGSDQSFTMSASSGNIVSDVWVDGASIGHVEKYTFKKVGRDHSIAAYFTGGSGVSMITVTHSDNGLVCPDGNVSVPPGGSKTFKFVPDSGYGVTDVIVDGTSHGPLSNYTFSGVTSPHTLDVQFGKGATYTISVSGGTGGTITPPGNSFTVTQGSTQKFFFTPTGNNVAKSVMVDGKKVNCSEGFTFGNIGMNHTLNVTFGVGDFTIDASADTHGIITPSGAVSIGSGQSKTFSIRTDSGYAIDDVIVDGSGKGAVRSVTFNNVKHNHTIHVKVKPADYIITISKTGNGGVTADGVPVSGTIGVNKGDSVTLDFTPEGKENQVKSVSVDGKKYAGAKSVTLSNIDANHTVAVSFGSYDYFINLSKEGNGSFTPNESKLGVNAGCQRSVSFKPDSGWYIDSVSVDNLVYNGTESFTFNRVGRNHGLKVVFKQGTGDHIITITSSGPGECDPTGSETVEHGGELSISMSAGEDAYLDKVTVDGKDMGRPAEFTFKGVGNNHTLSALFTSSPSYAITVQCPTTATADPIYAKVIKCDDASINIGEVDGYHIKDVNVDGKSFGSVSGVDITEIGRDHSISITTHSANTGKFKVSASAAGKCQLSPMGDVMLEQGDGTDVTCFPEDMWLISDTVADGKSLGAVDSVSIKNIGKDHTVLFNLVGPGLLSISAKVMEEDTNATLPATLPVTISMSVEPLDGGTVEGLEYNNTAPGGVGANGKCYTTTPASYKVTVTATPEGDGWQSGEASVIVAMPANGSTSCSLTIYVKGPNSDWDEWTATLIVNATGAGNSGGTCSGGTGSGPIDGATVTVTGDTMIPTSAVMAAMGSGSYSATLKFKTKEEDGKQADVNVTLSASGFATVESGATISGDSGVGIGTTNISIQSQEDDRYLPITVRFVCDEVMEGDTENRLFKAPNPSIAVTAPDFNAVVDTGILTIPADYFKSHNDKFKGIAQPTGIYFGSVLVELNAETVGPCELNSNPIEEFEIPSFYGGLQVTVLDTDTAKPIDGASVSIVGGSTYTTDANGEAAIGIVKKGTYTLKTSASKYASDEQSIDVDSMFLNSFEVDLVKNMSDLTIRLYGPNSNSTLFTGSATVTFSKLGIINFSGSTSSGLIKVTNIPYGDNYKITIDTGLYIDKEDYSYSFSGDLYEDITLSTKLTPDPNQPATLKVTAIDCENNADIPFTLTVKLKSDGSTIGGGTSGGAAINVPVLTASEYDMLFTSSGYKDKSQLVTIGEWIVEEEVCLDKIPPAAQLNFTIYDSYEEILSSPPSSILIKTESSGDQTITTVDGHATCTVQSSQSITITCTTPGYEIYKSTEYPDGGANNIEIHLTKIKSTSAKLTIQLKDSTTNNLITGDSITVRFESATPITTTNGFASFTDVANGSYTVYASGPNYLEDQTYMYIDGEDVTDDITLTHKPIPVKVTLRLANASDNTSVTNPATITFDGNATTNVTAGFITYNSVEPNKTYTIVIRALGFQTLSTTRYITEGEDFDETFDLQPGRNPITDPVSLVVTLYNATGGKEKITEYASVRVPALGEEQHTSIGTVTIGNMPKGAYTVEADASAFNPRVAHDVPVYNTNTTYDFYMQPLDPDLPGTCGVVLQHQFPTGTSKPIITMVGYLGAFNYTSTFENLNAFPYYLRKTEITAGSYHEVFDYASDMSIDGITQIVRVMMYWYCKPGMKSANVSGQNYPSYTPLPDKVKLLFNGKEFPSTIADGEVIQFSRAFDENNKIVNGKEVFKASDYLKFCPNLWNDDVKDKLHQDPNIIWCKADGNCKVKLTFSMNYYKGYYDDDDRKCEGPTC